MCANMLLCPGVSESSFLCLLLMWVYERVGIYLVCTSLCECVLKYIYVSASDCVHRVMNTVQVCVHVNMLQVYTLICVYKSMCLECLYMNTSAH